jgi:hypothetical protein
MKRPLAHRLEAIPHQPPSLLFTKRLSTEHCYNQLVAPNRPGYNISTRTTQKTPFLCCPTIGALVSVGVLMWSLLTQSIGALVAA